ncbi:RNA polymerase sigma-70 factor [Flectobacillus major]|jgi:RNA polymerase sigma-70 factor (ECF subfamily)|uniref:RNA polymerase sigma-70 factor n=1 Tax=Flectobacillus major TaxID=103 RepID=UPI000478DB15|nr:RNA polymerase sigma-70 factor [Flectobacillus major]
MTKHELSSTQPQEFPLQMTEEVEVKVSSKPLGMLVDGSELFIKKAFDTDPHKGCELLFKRYYQALCTHAVRYVYSREIAEDLVGDIFFNFWNTKAYLSVTTSYRAYLFRAVRNRAYNYIAYELKQSDSIDLATQQEGQLSDLPEQIMQYEELYTQIDTIVASLPKQCQKVFLMNRFEGKKSREIAEDLQISVRTVETHIQKALNTLKSGLKDSFLGLFFYLFIQ